LFLAFLSANTKWRSKGSFRSDLYVL
jgi:hypothetical protein